MKKLGVFLIVFGGAALFNRAELSSVDEGFIFNTTAALVEKQSWTMDERLSDRSFSRFSPLPSLFAAPFYFVADKFVEGPSAVGMPKKRDWLLFACGLSSCVLTAWTAVALLGLIRQLGCSESSAVWTSLLWAFGTLAFPYSSSLFHQVIATLLMVYVVQFAFAERIVPTIIATALLISVQLTLAAAVLPLALRDGWKPNRRSFVGLTLGVLFGFGLHVLSNYLRGDHWLHGAYETETFTTPTFVGFVGLFFSSGKGLLWFAPLAFAGMLMLLPFAHRRPEIGRPLLFAVACHCLVVIHWWAWHGSLSWGPRLLLPVMPLMMIPVADFIDRRMEFAVWQRRLLGSAAAVSILVNVWAATQPMISFLNHWPDGSMSEWVFIPSLTPNGGSWEGLNQAFFVRFEPSVRTGLTVGIAAGMLLVGAALVSKWATPNLVIWELLPWRAIAVVMLSFVPAMLNSSPLRDHHQRGRLSWNAPTYQGELHFPIRGIYRLETSHADYGSVKLGAISLSKSNRAAFIEAPPMSVPVSFLNTGATLLWTLPGEGSYRSPIPKEQFSSNKSGSQFAVTDVMVRWTWLLYVVAAVFYFDWLLGGRKMKSVPGEP